MTATSSLPPSPRVLTLVTATQLAQRTAHLLCLCLAHTSSAAFALKSAQTSIPRAMRIACDARPVQATIISVCDV
jgi:hypothetical protein